MWISLAAISHEKTSIWLRKGKTEFLLSPAQNYAIRTDLCYRKIDKARENSKFILFSETDEMIYHIISEFSKLMQREFKTLHD